MGRTLLAPCEQGLLRVQAGHSRNDRAGIRLLIPTPWRDFSRRTQSPANVRNGWKADVSLACPNLVDEATVKPMERMGREGWGPMSLFETLTFY